MAKQSIFNRASVERDTNTIVCESGFNANDYMKAGSMLRFTNEGQLYTVGRIEQFYCILDFVKESAPDQISVSSEDAKMLVQGDWLDVTYKEYKITPLSVSISNGGSGYSVGDTFVVEAGLAVKDDLTEEKDYSVLKVKDINENGSITEINVVKEGRYLKVPEEEVLLGWSPEGGSGSDAQFLLSYETINNRAVEQREVMDMEIDTNNNVYRIRLDSGLPWEIIGGKISCRKHKLILTSDYVGPTRWSGEIQMITDFTQNYGMPYLAQNSLSLPSIYNKSLSFWDEKIKSLELEIEELKKKIGD